MADAAEILAAMRRNPKDVRYADLCKVCDHYFGEHRQKGTSHRTYKTLWPGEPRVNIQSNKRKAKPYQVRQVIATVDRFEHERKSREPS